MREIIPPGSSLKIWSADQNWWNFGDVISFVLAERLFYVFDVWDQDVRILGSVISDGLVPQTPTNLTARAPLWRDNDELKVIYWGCGIREPGDFCEYNRQRVDFLSVRGPVTASALRLGKAAILGEPGLLLPALYSPKIDQTYKDKTVCIPHFSDQRDDEALRTASGCDLILRPNLRPDIKSVYAFIDALCSAKFVLSSALHGAVTAAAYGIPFAHWDTLDIDLPTKWQDFSALINMPNRFAVDIAAGEKLYEQLRGEIRLPRLWDLVNSAPYLLRHDALLKILQHDFKNQDGENLETVLNEVIRKTEASKEHFQKLEERVRYFSRSNFQNLQNHCRELEIKNESLSDSVKGLQDERIELTRALESASEANFSAATEIAELHSSLEASEQRRLTADFKLQELDKETAELRESIADLQKNADASIKEEDDLRSKISQLEDELKGLRWQETLARDEQPLRAKERAKVVFFEQKFAKEWQRKMQRNASDLLPAIFGGTSRAKKSSSRRLLEDLRLIEKFVSQFPERITGVSSEGRSARIATYLMGFTDTLPDFPVLCDADYNDLYPDIGPSGMRPLTHFVRYGRKEQRNPSPLFDTAEYCRKYPEANHLSESAIEHFLLWGAAKFYTPHPLFDIKDYLHRYPDVSEQGLNPLVHSLRFKRCTVHPLFDPNFYLFRNPDIVNADRHPLTHYLLHGDREGRNPHPLFNSFFYRSRYPSVEASGMTTLVHYVTQGGGGPRRVSDDFDPHFYLDAYRDIADAKLDPLMHYINHGRDEGRLPKAEAKRQKFPIVGNGQRPVVVMMDAFFPRPDKDSGSLDQISFIKIFGDLGFEVHFISLLEFHSSSDDTFRYAEGVKQLGAEIIRSDRYSFIEEYLFLHADRIKLIFLSRLDFGANYIDVAKTLCPEARVIFNTVDLHFLREMREAVLRNDEQMRNAAEDTKQREIAAIKRADVAIVVSDAELAVLQKNEEVSNCVSIPLIREFETKDRAAFKDRRDIAFIGGFSHRPNLDAVETFLDAVWPQIHAAHPEIVFKVVGSNMPDALRNRSEPGVEFIGYLETLDDLFESIRLTVAPLRWGAGAKGKLVSSLGNGVPCVASPVAAEGMGLVSDHEIIVAEMADMAEAVLRIYNDEIIWERLSMNGSNKIGQMYSLERGIGLVRDMLISMNVEIQGTRNGGGE